MTKVEFDEKMDAIVDAMLDYYEENEGDFVEDLEELDSCNGYLGSSDYKDYSHFLTCRTIEDILDNRSRLYLCDGIQELIEQLEELEQEEIDEIC